MEEECPAGEKHQDHGEGAGHLDIIVGECGIDPRRQHVVSGGEAQSGGDGETGDRVDEDQDRSREDARGSQGKCNRGEHSPPCAAGGGRSILQRGVDPLKGARRGPEDERIEVDHHHRDDPLQGVELDRRVGQLKSPHQRTVNIAGSAKELDPADSADIGRGDEGEKDEATKPALKVDVRSRDEPGHPHSDQHREYGDGNAHVEGTTQRHEVLAVGKGLKITGDRRPSIALNAMEEEQKERIGSEQKQRRTGGAHHHHLWLRSPSSCFDHDFIRQEKGGEALPLPHSCFGYSPYMTDSHLSRSIWS